MSHSLSSSPRLLSVDFFRALTMFLMLVVNDFAGIPNLPAWLKHAEMDQDMMGFSDTIFPAFLFCVGMSVMLALGRSFQNGKAPLSVVGHVFWRTVALVTMGLFSLNVQSFLHLPKPVFELLMVVCFFLIWNTRQPLPTFTKRLLTQGLGILLLWSMLLWCDSFGKPFHTGWWGILGLIGWTYMVCALVFFITRGRLIPLLVAWVLVNLFALLAHSGWLQEGYFSHALLCSFIPSDWGHHALGVSGMLTIALLRQLKAQPLRFLGLMAGLGIAFLALGIWAHQYWIISKFQCTPTWVYFCLALYFPLMGLMHFFIDPGQRDLLPQWFKPAATATLTCYTVPYVLYPLMQLTGFSYPSLFCSGLPGLLRSVCFSLFVIFLTRQLQRINFTLKI